MICKSDGGRSRTLGLKLMMGASAIGLAMLAGAAQAQTAPSQDTTVEEVVVGWYDRLWHSLHQVLRKDAGSRCKIIQRVRIVRCHSCID